MLNELMFPIYHEHGHDYDTHFEGQAAEHVQQDIECYNIFPYGCML